MKKPFLLPWTILLLCALTFACHNEHNSDDGGDDNIIPADTLEVPDNTDETVVLDSSAVYVYFEGDSAWVANAFPEEVRVVREGGHVSIVSSMNINYVLKGQSDNGSLTVSSDSDVYVVLDTVSLTSAAGQPPLRLKGKRRNVVYLNDRTQNALTDNSPADSEEKGCIRSDSSLVLAGKGQLTLVSAYTHAISGKAAVHVQEGTYKITAAKDGIHAAQAIVISGGDLSMEGTDDACQSEGSYIQMSGGSLIAESAAEKANIFDAAGNIYVQGGVLSCYLTGTAAKALKSDASVSLSGGTLLLMLSGGGMYDPTEADVTACIGIKAAGNLYVCGAEAGIVLSGEGGKGVKTGRSLYMQSGSLIVNAFGEKYVYSETLVSAAKAIKTGAHVWMTGGVLEATSSWSDGIDCDSSFCQSGGSCQVKALGDAVAAATTIAVSDGKIYAFSQTNDGLDGKGGITISGGKVLAVGANVDKKGGFETDGILRITGGSVLAVGNKNSKPTTYSNSQNAVSYASTQSFASGERFCLTDADGSLLMSYVLPQSYSAAFNLVFSAPSLATGSAYSLYQGGSLAEGSQWNGWAEDGSYTVGTLLKSFTQTKGLVKL